MIVCIRPVSIGLALLAVLFTSCNSQKTVKIHGKILKNGQPMVVSEDTYVTLSFVAVVEKQSDAKSHGAKFNQKTGTYTVELPAGKYQTMFVMALPPKKAGGMNVPSAPFKPETIHELTKDQQLDIEVPAK